VHSITKEYIKGVTSLWSFKPIPEWKNVMELMEKTSATLEGMEITLKKITNPSIWYVSIIYGHKIYQKNNDYIVSTTTIHITHNMIEIFVDYDYCELLRQNLMKKLKEIKKNTFRYDTLIFFLFSTS
jgi:hypothetical protein